MNEFAQQKELVARFRAHYPDYAQCTRQSLSGLNFGGSAKAARMVNQIKSTGTVEGESDLFFAVPANGFHGLFIELKADKNTKIQPGQLEYLDRMAELGYAAILCIGLEVAWESLTAYMESI